MNKTSIFWWEKKEYQNAPVRIIFNLTFALTRKGLPQFNGEPLLAVFVEAVSKVDAGAFVIASKQEEVFRIFDLVGEKSDDVFQVLFASVNVVAKE